MLERDCVDIGYSDLLVFFAEHAARERQFRTETIGYATVVDINGKYDD